METNLYTAIAAASRKVGGALEADKRNKEQNYDYLSSDKIISIAGQALAEQGVAVLPAVVEQVVELIERQGKTPRIDASVKFEMTLTNGTQAHQLAWVGRGSDYATPDKALYKAITSGHKYFLMKLLNIGAGNEDGEHGDEEQQERKTFTKKPEQHAPAPKPTPQPAQTAQPAGEPDDAPCTAMRLMGSNLGLDHQKHAEALINLLKLNGVTMGAALSRIALYREWKAITDDTQVSAQNALAGALPPTDN